ncbi:hypothetical protein L6Q96_10145 [Candidatus Binatia bacterium]|nr:hypothetical protein [Candidatus Binatia bacterium]
MKKTWSCVALAVGIGLSGCGGGGDGDGGAPSQEPSGVCEACVSNADCEDGLYCQPCLSNCGNEGSRCAGLGGSGASTISCGRAAYAGGCADVAGEWYLTEEVMATCTARGESFDMDESGGGTVSFEQKGCEVSYTVPETNMTRSGKIVGNRMRLVGRFLMSTDPGVRFKPNITVIDGEVKGSNLSMMGTGLARANISGVQVSCEGQSTAEGYRMR